MFGNIALPRLKWKGKESLNKVDFYSIFTINKKKLKLKNTYMKAW